MGVNKNTVSKFQTKLENAIQGLKKGLPGGGKSVTLRKKTYTAQQISSAFGNFVGLLVGIQNLKTSVTKQVATRKEQQPDVKQLYDDFVKFSEAAVGDDVEVLTSYGIPVKTRSKPSAQTTADAVKKRNQKRKQKQDSANAAAPAGSGDGGITNGTPPAASGTGSSK